jgi:hypothetical protein
MLQTIFAAFALIAAPALALAAEPAKESKHGGKVVETSGDHLLELVTDGRSIEVYVTHEDGKAEEVKDAKASATVLAGGKTEKIELAPGDANSLKGSGELEIGPGAIVVVTLTMAGHKPEQARFKLD